MTEPTRSPEEVQNLLQSLPSVDSLLRLGVTVDLVEEYGRSLTLEALRAVLDQIRDEVRHGQGRVPANAMIIQASREWLQDLLLPTLRPVINATGVIIHTNLGRAPLSADALHAMRSVGEGYSTLEYDLDAGGRGSRAVHAEDLLIRLLDTEAATVVNNNAAATLLMLAALCQGKEVITSRGQLVEIGGGFRVPDVLAQSGARLVEVGTTNRTHLRDYEAAIGEETAAILFTHHSNFKIVGFTAEPSLAELAELAHEHDILLLYDQGSGALWDTAPYGLAPEPTVTAGLEAGCDVVSFSGDKLLGGPQAGILCGQARLMRRIKRHPLARAMRPDKSCLAGLAATLTHYLTDHREAIPVWQMIARSRDELRAEANTWAARLQEQGIAAQTQMGESTVGGGSLPGTTLPTQVVAIEQPDVEALVARLRRRQTPVIGRIQDDRFLIDPRTVLPYQVEPLLRALIDDCEPRPMEGE